MNEEAARAFAEKHRWKNIDIHYLITTEEVLRALEGGETDYGVFAWESSRAGVVKESALAIAKFNFKKEDEITLQVNHALLSFGKIDESKKINIYSHPQALKEHWKFLLSRFPDAELIEEKDTALSAEKMSKGEYPENSLAIAPIGCVKVYGVHIYESNLPTNEGYETTFFLVRAKEV
jgi:prephenate dehydratase